MPTLDDHVDRRLPFAAPVPRFFRLRTLAAAVFAIVVFAPSAAYAQATLSGTVRDSSGAVLPGVTVEASSPALIEKTRSTVTDGTGQYRLTELRPGKYALNFTLNGFSPVKQQNVDVSGVAVITINIEMRVGGLQDTITVTSETPVVDVQSTTRQSVLDNSTIQELPAARGYGALLNAVPALQGGYATSQITPAMTFFNTYGGRPNEGRVQLDGINVGSAFNGAGVSGFAYDTSNAAEMQVTLSGGLGEAEVGAASVNIVPRTGGNRFAGSAFYSTAGEWSQGNNIDDELRSFNITEPAALVRAWDVNGALGGPIKQDRLWFYGNIRNFGQQDVIAGRYGNANAGDPTRWDYVEDRSVQARNATATQVYSLRLTGQATQKDKLGFYVDQQYVCTGSSLTTNGGGCRDRESNWVALGGALNSPESTTTYNDNTRQRIIQATWTRPQTSRLLLDAGYSTYISRWGWMEPPGATTNLIPVTEQSARACTEAAPCLGGRTTGTLVPLAGFTYRGLDNFFDNKQSPHNWKANVSYVTGAHNIKVGYQGNYYIEETTDFANDSQLTYTFNNGAPVSFAFRIAPWQTSNRTTSHGLFAQDQWTLGNVTLQGAVRYDRAWSWFPAEHNGAPQPSRFNAAPITFPRSDGVTGYNDITTRIGAAWDVFGTGKTALKVNLGKYLQAATNQTQYTINNPALDGRNGRGGPRFQSSSSRSWTDRNNNFAPDCDLLNSASQNPQFLSGTTPNPAFDPTVDSCGAWNNLNFGDINNPLTINPDVLHGWGVRPYDWLFGINVQHEILPRVSLEAGYNRRWFGNFFVTDNRAVSPSDYEPWSFVAPLDSRLPDGGGYTIEQFNITPAAQSRSPSNYYTFETDYGDARTQYWHGFDVNVTARPRNGLTFQGGTNTGRGVSDRCDTQMKIDSPDPRNCHVAEKWLTNFRGLATYTVPKIDVLVSGIIRFQTTATGFFTGGDANPGSNGASLAATYPVPNSVVFASLGRLPTNGQLTGTTNVNLLETGQLYPEQIRVVDMRLAKVLRFGRTRADIGIDAYNVFNTNVGTTFNTNYGSDGATWLRPTAIYTPRFLRFNVTFNY